MSKITNLFDSLHLQYGHILDESGMNARDPQLAHMFHYNKIGNTRSVDPANCGRTYVFFTRPALNFSKLNIDNLPELRMKFNTKIGKQVMPLLTQPEYNIYADTSETMKLINEYSIKRDSIIAKLAQLSENNIDPNNLPDKYEETVNSLFSNYAELQKRLGGKAKDFVLPPFDDDWADQSGVNLVSDKKQEYLEDDSAVSEAVDRYIDSQPYKASSIPFTDIKTFYSRFNTLLGNSCIEFPPPPDRTTETYESEADKFGNNVVYAKGSDEYFKSGQFTATFFNPYNDSVRTCFEIWNMVKDGCARGDLMPRIEHILDREIDYTCSVFVISTDVDDMTIKSWCRYQGVFPLSTPRGMVNKSQQQDVDAWRTLSIPFAYNKVFFENPYDLADFNYLSRLEWAVKKDTEFEKLVRKHPKLIKKEYKYSDIFNKRNSYERGVSGKIPTQLVNIRSFLPEFLNDSTFGTSNSTYGGFPYISDFNKLVFINPDTFYDYTTATLDRSLK